MATRGVTLWSTTAATNNTADPSVNWSEGQTPGSVNDSARAMMAGVAGYRNDGQGITTAGTATAYTVTTYATFASAAAMSGYVFTIIPHADSGAAPTLAVDSLTARAINYSTGVAVATGALKLGTPYAIKYVHATTEFILLGGVAVLPASIVATAAIADQAVTYAKIQNVANYNRLLGRASTSASVVEELTIGSGLVLTSTTLSAPATPVQASFKNLSIKVATNTTVAVAADYVTMFDGTNYRTVAISATCNLGSNGAVNTLDAGTIAIDTWYYIWAISNGSTDGTLASTSSTAPTMPSGYTYKARIGAVQTISGSATLYGTWQFGRKAQYVVGLAQTAALPTIASGSTGTQTDPPTWISKSLTRITPTTASEIFIQQYYNANTMIAAPSTGYGGHGSTTKPPPIDNASGPASVIAHMLLEAASVQYASNGNSNALFCMGWIDNI